MYKIIACDLDETLLNNAREISKADREAIRAAADLGVKFVPATGRGFPTVQGTLKALGLEDRANEYTISFNGGAITENKDNRILDFNGLDYNTAQAIFHFGSKHDVCVHVYTKEDVFLYNSNQAEWDYISGRMEGCISLQQADISFLTEVPIVKVLFQSTDSAYLKWIETEISSMTKGKIDISYSSNRYIEFNRLHVNKGQGLLKLAALLKVNPQDTIAIGDNFNDLSMIKAAGLGVGVGNVVAGVREHCDYVCRRTHENSAVAEVIETFILKSM